MKRGDVLVVLMILALIALGSLPLFSAKQAGWVIISVHGQEVYRASVTRSERVQAGEYNVVGIEDGTVRMLHADCSDQICVHTAPIRRAGQSIICLPNEVVVRLEAQDGEALDSISY